MLSILIPTYNSLLIPLVIELHKQCLECRIDFEILCQDDASNSIFNIENETINQLENCNFGINITNLAHRENRNSLVRKSKYNYLLFIDGDSIILKKNYIQKYIDTINDYDAVYGGRLHPENCPSENQKLRWKYGKYIEDISVENRNKRPYSLFLFNNTLIRKDLFDKIKFDPIMKKYGHDDTQFSYQMMLLESKIKHIENPVLHNDIDFNIVFIKKTKVSLENLLQLYIDKKIDKNYVKMIRLYVFLKKTKLSFFVAKTFQLFEKNIIKNLEGNNPNLLIFNIFRVGYLCSLKG